MNRKQVRKFALEQVIGDLQSSADMALFWTEHLPRSDAKRVETEYRRLIELFERKLERLTEKF